MTEINRVARVRWGWITGIQLVLPYGIGVAVGVAGMKLGDDYLGFVLIVAGLITLFCAGPPLVGAFVAHRMAVTKGGGQNAEVRAVGIGALLGGVVVMVVSFTFLGTLSPVAGLVFGFLSAAGFAVWVIAAWARVPAARENPADSLN